MPEGVGRVNPAGLDFYSRLIDELLAAGITPFVTLFHWDYPYALFCRGGWLNPASPDWFAEYSAVVVRLLSDRVKYWFTQNEPQVYIGMGHHSGEHAPGLKLDWPEVMRAWHNSMLAHGKSVQAIRANTKQPAFVGAAPTLATTYPATESPEDIDAARKATFSVWERTPWTTTMFCDPVFFKRYPEDGLKVFEKDMPAIAAGDMETIGQPLDFLAFNHYRGIPVRMSKEGKPEFADFPPGFPLTAFYWEVTPPSLYWAVKFLYERYNKPIYITENGLANTDWVALDGKVHDPQRIDFTTRYLQGVKRACAEGVDVRGYFHWSIMDNFEWAEGYKQRFGMVYVDFTMQKRIPKDSAHWYKEVIATNGANL